MIADYKLFHGAALAELVDAIPGPVTFQELVDAGRMSSYVVNGKVGLHLKHSGQKLHPWPFTFSNNDITSLETLLERCATSFLVLVCNTDGMCAIPLHDALKSLNANDGAGSWLRVDRRKRQMYRVHGTSGEFGDRYKTNLDAVIRTIIKAAE